MIKLNKTKNILPICSTDTLRPPLCHPHYEDGHLYATCGHTAVCVQIDTEEDTKPRSIPKEAVKLALNKKAYTHIELNPETVEVVVDSSKTSFEALDCRFPIDSIFRVFNEQENRNNIKIGLNAKFLFDLAKSMGSNEVVLSLDPDVKLSPIGVRPLNIADDTSKGIICQITLGA